MTPAQKWELPGAGFKWDPSAATTVPQLNDAELPERFRTYAAPKVRAGRTFARAALESGLDAAALPVKAASRAADYFTGHHSEFSDISGKEAAESLEWLYDKSDPAQIRREEKFAEGEIPQAQAAGRFVGEYAGGAPLAALTGRVPMAGAIARDIKKGERKGTLSGDRTFYRVHSADEPGETILNPRRPDGWVAEGESPTTQPLGISAADDLAALNSYKIYYGLAPQPGDRVVRIHGTGSPDRDADIGAVRALADGYEDVGDAQRFFQMAKRADARGWDRDRIDRLLGRWAASAPPRESVEAMGARAERAYRGSTGQVHPDQAEQLSKTREFLEKNPDFAERAESAARFFDTNPEAKAPLVRLSDGSSGMNRYLRDRAQGSPRLERDTNKRAAQTQQALTSAIRAGHSYDGEVSRGLNMPADELQKWLKDGYVRNASFLSASADPSVAAGSMMTSPGVTRDNPAVLMRMRGGSGVPIAGISAFPHEQEVLFPRGALWKITGHSVDEQGRNVLDMVAVPRAPEGVTPGVAFMGGHMSGGSTRPLIDFDDEDR